MQGVNESFLHHGWWDSEVGALSRHTPLYLAASKGHLEVVKLLVEKGAYIIYPHHDCKDQAIHVACRRAADLERKKESGLYWLSTLFYRGDEEVILNLKSKVLEGKEKLSLEEMDSLLNHKKDFIKIYLCRLCHASVLLAGIQKNHPPTLLLIN